MYLYFYGINLETGFGFKFKFISKILDNGIGWKINFISIYSSWFSLCLEKGGLGIYDPKVFQWNEVKYKYILLNTF